jgi:hypothetical protein
MPDDAQSGIASILNQMQSTAERSRPPPIDTIQNANRPMPSRRDRPMTIEELLELLLSQQR